MSKEGCNTLPQLLLQNSQQLLPNHPTCTELPMVTRNPYLACVCVHRCTLLFPDHNRPRCPAPHPWSVTRRPAVADARVLLTFTHPRLALFKPAWHRTTTSPERRQARCPSPGLAAGRGPVATGAWQPGTLSGVGFRHLARLEWATPSP